MPGNHVNQIVSDHKHGLLLYFSEKGLFYFDTRLNKIIRKYNYPIKNSVRLCNSDINPNYLIVIGENGKIQTINRYDIKNLKTLSYSKNSNGSLAFFLMENGKKINVATDKIFKNTVYAIGKNTYEPIYGLGILVKENGKVRDTITENEGLGSNLLSGVYQTPSKDLIFTTLGGGLILYKNTEMVKLGIVDDNTMNRKTIREKLKPYADFTITVEADNGEGFFEELAHCKQEELPDVVLMDLEMPILDGISTISLASVKHRKIKFIVLTIFEDNDKIFEAIKAGASGYLLKEDKAINIVEAITNVVEFNGIPMSPAIARRAMKLLSEAPKPKVPKNGAEALDVHLSDREMEILREIVKGISLHTIAENLFISPNTVRTHVNNIYKKLHLNSRSQIINFAYKKNWV